MHLLQKSQLNLCDAELFIAPPKPVKHSSNYSLVSIAGGLLLIFDIVCLLLAAHLSAILYMYWLAPVTVIPRFASDLEKAALVAAVLAPFILYDKRFGFMVGRGPIFLWMRSYAMRLMAFTGIIFIIGGVCMTLERFPNMWLLLWFATSLTLTLFTRTLLAQFIRRLQRLGLLAQVIAVVGAGLGQF